MSSSASLILQKVGSMFAPSEPDPVPLPLPDHLISLASPEGIALLMRSRIVADYLRLTPHYEAQESPKFCGPATIAICLNALDLPAPDAGEAVRPRFTQHNIFTERTQALRSRDMVAREGMGLAVLAEFVTAHGGRPEVRFAEDGSLADFRETARAVLDDAGRHLAANYSRAALGQEGRGHTSPLAAYDEESDRFLVLDTSRVRYPAVWARAEDLFGAMNTQAGRNTRGFAIIGRA